MTETDEVLDQFHAVNGWMYRAIWYCGGGDSNGRTKWTHAICDNCLGTDIWPEHWPSGYWDREKSVGDVSRCHFCGVRMKTLVLTEGDKP